VAHSYSEVSRIFSVITLELNMAAMQPFTFSPSNIPIAIQFIRSQQRLKIKEYDMWQEF